MTVFTSNVDPLTWIVKRKLVSIISEVELLLLVGKCVSSEQSNLKQLFLLSRRCRSSKLDLQVKPIILPSLDIPDWWTLSFKPAATFSNTDYEFFFPGGLNSF